MMKVITLSLLSIISFTGCQITGKKDSSSPHVIRTQNVETMTNILQTQLLELQRAELRGKNKMMEEEQRQKKLADEASAIITRVTENEKNKEVLAESLKHKKELVKQVQASKIRRSKENERLADKYREQEYEDKLRNIKIERQKLALQQEMLNFENNLTGRNLNVVPSVVD